MIPCHPFGLEQDVLLLPPPFGISTHIFLSEKWKKVAGHKCNGWPKSRGRWSSRYIPIMLMLMLCRFLTCEWCLFLQKHSKSHLDAAVHGYGQNLDRTSPSSLHFLIMGKTVCVCKTLLDIFDMHWWWLVYTAYLGYNRPFPRKWNLMRHVHLSEHGQPSRSDLDLENAECQPRSNRP